MSMPLRVLAATVSYQDFRAYLLARHWTNSPSRRDCVAIYRSPGSGDVEIQLPLDTSFADYADAILLAARCLARHEDRNVELVLRDISSPQRDLIRYGLIGEATKTGSISLQAGAALVGGALKSLLASACSVQRPRRVHPRMTLGDAETFVRGCRLGQTEVGSFVLTIDAPLDIRNELLHTDAPFGRRVTTYLFAATSHLVEAIRRGDPRRVLDEDENSPLVSANLCEAMVEMMPADESADLRLSSAWSPLIPAPSGVTSDIRIERTMFESIEQLAAQLRPSHGHEPALFVGTVVELSGVPNIAGKLEGDVVLQVQADDQILKVKLALGPDDYGHAVTAHLQQRYVTVRGVLHRGRRTHTLEDPRDFAVLGE